MAWHVGRSLDNCDRACGAFDFGTMIYHEWSVNECSGGLAVCGWRLRGAAQADGKAGASAEPALPDGCPELLFNFGDPFEYHGPDGTVRRQPQAFLVGQITRPFDVRPTGVVDLVAIRFEAHGSWGLTAPHAPPINDWIDAFGWGAAAPSAWRAVQELWHHAAPLEDADREHAIYQWLVRHAPATLAQVAADSGYCDESHLVRDFRAFVGEPPAAFLSALPAFTASFIARQ